jgi:hypothetical protein
MHTLDTLISVVIALNTMSSRASLRKSILLANALNKIISIIAKYANLREEAIVAVFNLAMHSDALRCWSI